MRTLGHSSAAGESINDVRRHLPPPDPALTAGITAAIGHAAGFETARRRGALLALLCVDLPALVLELASLALHGYGAPGVRVALLLALVATGVAAVVGAVAALYATVVLGALEQVRGREGSGEGCAST